jgi:hypothetical protein
MIPPELDGQSFSFEPQLDLPPKSSAEVSIGWPDGRASVEIRCLITHALIEIRPECQVLRIESGKNVIVAAPGSIQRPKLSWRLRFVRWMAKE